MPRFYYMAQDLNGQEANGMIDAPSYPELVQALQAKDLFLVSCQEIPVEVPPPAVVEKRPAPAPAIAPSPTTPRPTGKEISTHSLLTLLEQLHFQMRSGVPLLESLRFIRSNTTDKALLSTLPVIISEVERGNSLSTAVTRCRPAFPHLVSRLFQAGEMSGSQDVVIGKLITHLKRQEALRNKVMLSLIYPSILVATAFGTIFLMTIFVLPKFTEFYSGGGATLPFATQVLLAIVAFTDRFRWILLGAVIVALIALLRLLREVPYNRAAAELVMRTPIVKEIFMNLVVARFAATLGMMLENGVPILMALDIARGIVANKAIEDEISATLGELKTGQSLTNCFNKHTRFPDLIVNLVAVGEQSGRLAEVLAHIGDHYEERTRTSMERLFAVIEPALLLGMGVIVGFIALALLMPVFNLSQGVPG